VVVVVVVVVTARGRGRDEVQTPSIFFVHHFVPLLTRLRIFLD
jgi:hypothetical protein